MRKIDAPALVEQVIAVPNISLDRVPQGSVRRRSRRAEELVEVPTIVSYSSLQQRTAEQTIGIPVPHGRGGRVGQGGLQGVSQGQGSTALCGADIPAPRSGGLQGSSQDMVQRLRLLFSHVPAGAVDEPFQWFFFALSLDEKSAGLGPHSGSELGADFNPWTPAACADSMALEEDELETVSESGSEVEEDTATRFGTGFRPLWVCMRFLELHMGRPVRECAYGDRCTFAHSWAKLHPEASAHEQELASCLPD